MLFSVCAKFPRCWTSASCPTAFHEISGTRRCSFFSRSRRSDARPTVLRVDQHSVNTTGGGRDCDVEMLMRNLFFCFLIGHMGKLCCVLQTLSNVRIVKPIPMLVHPFRLMRNLHIMSYFVIILLFEHTHISSV